MLVHGAALLVLYVYLLQPISGFTVDEEVRLRQDLFSNYSRAVRPDQTTNIKLSFHPTAIKSMDIKNQQFSLSGWWSMRWTDSRLVWNSANYNNIFILQVFEDKMWSPTLVVDNSVDDLSAIDEDSIPLRVDERGTVTWNPPGLLTVSCEMDITYFPFDSQICTIQVTSFGYTIQELDIKVFGDGVVLTYFQPDGEWDLLDNWNDRTTFTEDGYTYAKVLFYFSLQRKPLFYGLNMILPVVINSFLTIFVFLLPADSGEKIGYCLTVLLAFMVILTLIATDLPTTAKYTSILELYIALVLIMGGLSVVFSIFVLEVYFRPEEKPIPNYVRSLTLLGMRLCCWDGCCNRKVQPEGERESVKKDHMIHPFNGPHNGHLNSVDHLTDALGRHDALSYSEGHNHGYTGHDGLPLKPSYPRKHSEFGLRPPTAMATEEDRARGGEITWQTVSIVMDGLLFRFYTLFLIISSAVFMAILVSGEK